MTTRRTAVRPRPSRTRPHRDLNSVRPTGFAAGADKAFWATRTRTTVTDSVTVHCGDLSDAVVEFITGAESIVGCVAWLTSKPVLEALASRPGGVSICVQKEPNLRRESVKGPGGKWPAELRRRYKALPPGPLRRTMPDPLPRLAGPPRIGSIRCVGFAASGGNPNAPRMHHKFVVAGKVTKVAGRDLWVAERVWTGSFNFSSNAGDSAENAVVIDDQVAAGAYLDEFARISALSESLDWSSRLAKPEHRKR